MDVGWGPSAIVGLAALIGNALVAFGARQRNDGAQAEKIKAHGARILSLEGDVKDQGERISNVEGRLDALPAHSRGRG